MEKIKTLLKKLREKWGFWLLCFLGIPMALLFIAIFIGGLTATELTCERTPSTGTVDCTKEARLLWVIPLGTRSVRGVQGAQIADSTDPEGGAGYRVELLTAQGTVPLNAVYTSGYSTKSEVTEEINTFVKETGENNLVVTEPGLLSEENCAWGAIWLMAWLFWKWLNSGSGRKKDKPIKSMEELQNR